MTERWIAERMQHIESSGIRRVFELARELKDPINLSIGQPHFDVPEPIKAAARSAIDRGANAYTVTQGIPELRDKIRAEVARRYPHRDRDIVVTAGTSGGLSLAIQATVNPGDEVIVFDPYFALYPHLITLAGGRPAWTVSYNTANTSVAHYLVSSCSNTYAVVATVPKAQVALLRNRVATVASTLQGVC